MRDHDKQVEYENLRDAANEAVDQWEKALENLTWAAANIKDVEIRTQVQIDRAYKKRRKAQDQAEHAAEEAVTARAAYTNTRAALYEFMRNDPVLKSCAAFYRPL